jgi:hypothetical protein
MKTVSLQQTAIKAIHPETGQAGECHVQLRDSTPRAFAEEVGNSIKLFGETMCGIWDTQFVNVSALYKGEPIFWVQVDR